jgi:hypothetical protein
MVRCPPSPFETLASLVPQDEGGPRTTPPPQDEASKAPPRAPRWLVRSSVFSCFFADSGPFRSVAVPDQRCTASRCTASGTRVIDCRIAFPSHQLNQSTLPRSRGAFFAPGVCFFASLTRIEGERSAERRSGVCETPVGHAMTRRVRRLRGALRPMTRDARLSALHRGDGAVCCGDKGLDCLPAANGSTGAQRLFTALSHRAAR